MIYEVPEVDEPQVFQKRAEFIPVEDSTTTDDNGLSFQTSGTVNMHLTNGRSIMIAQNGLWDLQDEGEWSGYVAWDELLSLLDQIRASGKN